MRIDGLFRHGFLVTPALVDFVAGYLKTGELHPLARTLWRTAS